MMIQRYMEDQDPSCEYVDAPHALVSLQIATAL